MTIGAIDIHSHVVPAKFPRYLGHAATPHWPAWQEPCGCRKRTMLIDGRVFRAMGSQAWDVADRLEIMDEIGLQQQVISPLPELFSYWLTAQDGDVLCRHVNDAIGTMIANAPDRLIGLGGLPMQAPDLAVRELERLMATGLFRGVELGTNVDGAPLGAPQFAPVFAAAEALGAVLFIHPERPVGRERLVGPGILANLVAHPCDTSFALASLITAGVLDRHPGLKIAVAHGGGAFPYVLPRLEYGWRTIPGLSDLAGRPPAEQVAGLYWDNVVYDTGIVDFLIARFGPDRLCLGTDLPAPQHDGAPFNTIAHLPQDMIAKIRHDNAARLFGV
ncbi:amidohydrolase family protein [Actibacterium sp. D379-3]